MSDTRVVPRNQLEQRMSTQARDIRRLKADTLDTAAVVAAGFGYAGDILSGVNWNTYTTHGVYRVGLASWSGSSNHPSIAYSYGTLVVHAAGNSVTQTFYTHSADNGVWTRTKWNASDWTTWGVMPTLAEHPTKIAFTPQWGNLTEGSGTNSGYYIQESRDKIVVMAQFTFAADSSISAQPTLAMPNGATSALALTVNVVTYRDAGTPRSYPGFAENVTGLNTLDFFCERHDVSSAYVTREPVSATVPFTWTTGDIIRVAFSAILS